MSNLKIFQLIFQPSRIFSFRLQLEILQLTFELSHFFQSFVFCLFVIVFVFSLSTFLCYNGVNVVADEKVNPAQLCN